MNSRTGEKIEINCPTAHDSTVLYKANRTLKFRRQQGRDRKGAVRLGREANLFLRNIARPAVKNASVPEAFEQIIGPDMAQRCRIDSITAGTLKVRTKPGPFMFELYCQAGPIVEQLQQRCPSANIRQMKLVPLETG